MKKLLIFAVIALGIYLFYANATKPTYSSTPIGIHTTYSSAPDGKGGINYYHNIPGLGKVHTTRELYTENTKQ